MLITSGIELFIFTFIEILAIIIFIICFKISRKNGGVFDRRIYDRRSKVRRENDWIPETGFFPEKNFSRLTVELFEGSEVFDIDIDRRIYGRRHGDRRKVS
ncbi:MAG: hypothetical protein JW864_02270 [Spirochaetes bacterium]|nr:hypothetical protein [Spirochaetota bacterium]